MSAEAVVRGRLVDALKNDGALLAGVNDVYDRPTPRATPPYVVIEAASSSDWGTKDRQGCEVRMQIKLIAIAPSDDGIVGARIAAVIAGLRGRAGDWDIVSARVVRTRCDYDRSGSWTEITEVRARCLAHAEFGVVGV